MYKRAKRSGGVKIVYSNGDFYIMAMGTFGETARVCIVNIMTCGQMIWVGTFAQISVKVMAQSGK